jgi:hypothetical protein
MNKSPLISFITTIVFLSCYSPCEKINKKDIAGIYYSLNPQNSGKQYIQLFEDGRFYNFYCDKNTSIREWGIWKNEDCKVYIDNIQCYNTPLWDTSRTHLAGYTWIKGKLSLGENDVSFKKVNGKPKLVCDN